MRNRLLTIGAASLIAMSAVVAVGAQRAGGPRGGPPPGNQPPPNAQAAPETPNRPGERGPAGIGARLGLTDDQQKAVADIVRKMRDDIAPVVDQLTLARRNLHRELFADKRDDAQANKLAAQVAALEKQVFDARIASQRAIADLLTAEQRQRARTDGFSFGPGGRGGRGGPGFQGGGPRLQGNRSPGRSGPAGPRGRGAQASD